MSRLCGQRMGIQTGGKLLTSGQQEREETWTRLQSVEMNKKDGLETFRQCLFPFYRYGN